MSSRLFIGNLDFSAQEDELREMFAPFGAIASLSVVLDRETGRARGFGFVEFKQSADAQSAIVALDGKDFRGRSLRVSEARERTDSRNERPSSGPRRTDRW